MTKVKFNAHLMQAAFFAARTSPVIALVTVVANIFVVTLIFKSQFKYLVISDLFLQLILESKQLVVFLEITG